MSNATSILPGGVVLDHARDAADTARLIRACTPKGGA